MTRTPGESYSGHKSTSRVLNEGLLWARTCPGISAIHAKTSANQVSLFHRNIGHPQTKGSGLNLTMHSAQREGRNYIPAAIQSQPATAAPALQNGQCSGFPP